MNPVISDLALHGFNKSQPLKGKEYPVILASQSPRRKQLLEWAEQTFQVLVVPTDESFPPHLSIGEIPVHIARQKAVAVSEQLKKTEEKNYLNPIILAADTVVVLQNQVIGKPKDREDAIAILQSLSGKKHQVITGVVLLHQEREIAFAEVTHVQFHSLSKEQIEFYVDRYQPYDKAGAYAIQEWIGVVGVQSIEGDFYNVMGLPISRVVQSLQILQTK